MAKNKTEPLLLETLRAVQETQESVRWFLLCLLDRSTGTFSCQVSRSFLSRHRWATET